MSAFHFANPPGLLAALAVPLLWLAFRHGDRERATSLARWNGSAPAPPPAGRRALHYSAVLLLALALARPVWHAPTAATTRPGDIVFLLDVSRSMLAADAAPSRLARAKTRARALAREAAGQRLALVAFSGSQSVECPLTPDREYFLDALESASRDSVARGGTALPDAVRFALSQVFDDVLRGRRTLVILSDGGDPDFEATSAAPEAAARGVAIRAIGFGDEREGALVPRSAADTTPFLYEGQPVRTRLNAAALRQISGGGYLHESACDPAAFYRRWLAPVAGSAGQPEAGDLLWTLPFALAALCLALEPRLPERRRPIAAALLLAVLFRPPAGFAQTVEEWFGKGLGALRAGSSQEAVQYFSDTARWAPELPQARFNLGKALYDYRAFPEAAANFELALGLSRDRAFQALCRLGQGNALFRDAEAMASAPLRAIGRMEQSLAAYREALRLDPRLPLADFNRQVAERRLEQLRERAVAPTMRQPESPGDVLRESPHSPSAAGRNAEPRPSGARDW